MLYSISLCAICFVCLAVSKEVANIYLSEIFPSLGFKLSSRRYNYLSGNQLKYSDENNRYHYLRDEYSAAESDRNFVCDNKSKVDFVPSYIKLGLDNSTLNEEILTLGYAFEGRLVLPAAVNLLTNIILRRQLYNQNISLDPETDAMHVRMSAHLFPYSSTNQIFKSVLNSVFSLLLFFPLAILASIGAMCVLSFAATEIISERTV